MERRETRREFLKRLGQIGAGLAGITIITELAKREAKNTIENAPEGIYYLITGKKIQLGSITEKNYTLILTNLRELLSEKLKLNVDLKIYDDLNEGLEELGQSKDKTIIIVTWPTKEDYSKREPSLGVVLDIKENYIKVWDPNPDEGIVEYKKTLNIWREKKRPLACLIIDKKIELDPERLEEIRRSIKEIEVNR